LLFSWKNSENSEKLRRAGCLLTSAAYRRGASPRHAGESRYPGQP
jgi:hypothetical protein